MKGENGVNYAYIGWIFKRGVKWEVKMWTFLYLEHENLRIISLYWVLINKLFNINSSNLKAANTQFFFSSNLEFH